MIRIHHTGYAVANLTDSAAEFLRLGYRKVGQQTVDSERNVVIQFMRNGDYLVELIAPLNDKAPVKGILRKVGPTPYHICYEADDLDSEVEKLSGDGYLVVERQAPAPAIRDRRVAFLFKKDLGLIELVETDAPAQS